MNTVLPENEAARLNELRRYQILDTLPEPAFDRIAEVAALFQVPMAVVSLVDEDRVWFKSRLGIHADHSARDAGLCASAILSPGFSTCATLLTTSAPSAIRWCQPSAFAFMRPLPCAPSTV
jgi:hypothetical protein